MKVSLTDRSDSKSIVLYSTILLIATGMLMTGCRKEDYAHGAKGCQENCIQILGKVVNPNNPEDRNKIAPDGYTYLEKYINSLCNE